MIGMRIEEREASVRFTVRVQPRASRTELAGAYGDGVKVRLTAPPVEGAANQALTDFLADRLGVPGGSVAVVRGHRGRTKLVEVRGIRAEAVRAALTA